MAWNEPGGGNRDPWGGQRGNDGPPDLDDIARKMKEKMNRFFGGAGGKGGKGASNPISLSLLGVVLVAAWALSGIYIVAPAERGIVLQLGEYNRTATPGPHWYMRFVERLEKLDVDNVRTVSHRAKMLTKDENIIQVELAVQYRIMEAKDYLFQVRDPDYTLQEATESALREVIGGITMDEFLSGGRGEIVAQTKILIQSILEKYQTGLLLTSVNLQDPQPPEEVQGAFEDAIKAQEDEVRYKNQAQAYARDIIPRARGDAISLVQEAEAYKEQVIAKADGETSRFLQTLAEYKKAPAITRKRLYLETMEAVLSNTSKVIMQTGGGNSLMYLPLDKLMENRDAPSSTRGASSSANPATATGDRRTRRNPVREGAGR